MRYLLISVLVLPLQGCWFVMFPIPSSLFQEGNACAGDGTYAGQVLRHDDGRSGTVAKVIGRHQRCPSAARPLLVEIKYD